MRCNFKMFPMNDTDNVTSISTETNTDEYAQQTKFITRCAISSIGIVTNFTVIIVFLNDRKLRKKIPNISVINQVSLILHDCVLMVVFLHFKLGAEDQRHAYLQFFPWVLIQHAASK